MKIYVNWELEKIAKTVADARDFMVANGECYSFAEYLTNKLGFSVEEIFNLREEYEEYLEKVIKNCWEVVEI